MVALVPSPATPYQKPWRAWVVPVVFMLGWLALYSQLQHGADEDHQSSRQRLRQMQGNAEGYRRCFGGQRAPGRRGKGAGHAQHRTVWGHAHARGGDR
jgi:hypothetical protein